MGSPLGWLGNAADFVGTALGLPELGVSEALSGGPTKNTNKPAYNAQTGQGNYTINGVTYNAAGDPISGRPSGGGGAPSGGAPAGGANPAYAGGSGGGGAYIAPRGPSAAQVNPLIASLSSLDTVLGNKNQQSNDEYTRAIQGYDAQDALDRAAYDKNVHTNEQNLTANDQAALLNAANGASGLKGVLASLGALSGSGLDTIRRLVGLAANSDSGSARQTFDVNADNLNEAWGRTAQQEKQRRDDAAATRANNLQNNSADVLNSRQSIYQQLANLYGAGTPQGNDYAAKATALAPEIAATTRATVAPYAPASGLFTPQTLQTYLAGTKNLNVNTTPGSTTTPGQDMSTTTAINSPVFANQKKDQLTGVA